MDVSRHPPAELDGFSTFFPLPFRIAIILVAGKRAYLCGRESSHAIPDVKLRRYTNRILGMGPQPPLLVFGKDCKHPPDGQGPLEVDRRNDS